MKLSLMANELAKVSREEQRKNRRSRDRMGEKSTKAQQSFGEQQHEFKTDYGGVEFI